MTYDFDTIIERTGKDALAVDMPAMERESGEGYFAVPMKSGRSCIWQTITISRPNRCRRMQNSGRLLFMRHPRPLIWHCPLPG